MAKCGRSVQVVHDTFDTALLVALVGAPDQFLEAHRLQRLAGSGYAAEQLVTSKADHLSWTPSSSAQPPPDWAQLVAAAGAREARATCMEGSFPASSCEGAGRQLKPPCCARLLLVVPPPPPPAGLRRVAAVPIRVGEKPLGILTLGFTEGGEQHAEHAL